MPKPRCAQASLKTPFFLLKNQAGKIKYLPDQRALTSKGKLKTIYQRYECAPSLWAHASQNPQVLNHQHHERHYGW